MNIPLLYALNEPGFYELMFKPYYNPKVLICDRHESNPSSMPVAGKGVYVLADTQRGEDDSFFVFVGQSGVTGEKATLCGSPDSRINRVWRKEWPGRPDVIADWDKAILIFDWEDDLRAGAERRGSMNNEEELLSDVMRNEVLHLEKLLRDEVEISANLNLANEAKNEDYFMLNPDSRRYDYYLGLAMLLIRMITE